MTVKTLRQRKLSTLLALALKDVRKQERAENSRVDMFDWLRQNGECVACAAGSVMRWTLGCTLPKATPWEFDSETADRLCAVNRLRCGDALVASQYLGVTIPRQLQFVNVAEYDSANPEPWHADMAKLLARLRKAGL